jgi:diacylglycerol kinase family enzyme
VECTDCDGNPITRHFLNGACFGLTTEVRGAWGGPADEPRHGLEGLARVLRVLKERDRSWVSLERDGHEIYRGPIVAGLVMVGKFYPGLGEVAPNAEPCDGALDLVGLTGKLGPAELGWLARVRPGWAGVSRRWTAERGEEFAASGIAGPVRLELDGVATGRLPARFTVLARQIQMIVPAVPVRLMKPAFQPLPAVAERAAVAGNLRLKSPSAG